MDDVNLRLERAADSRNNVKPASWEDARKEWGQTGS